jgi:hypothetical protein
LWLLGVDDFSTGEALLASIRQGGLVFRASERAMQRHNAARRTERSWHSDGTESREFGLGTNIVAGKIPCNRQTLIPIRVVT